MTVYDGTALVGVDINTFGDDTTVYPQTIVDNIVMQMNVPEDKSYTVKFFLWDGFANISPISEAVLPPSANSKP
jgi:hypothetical protein